ncbi:cobalamin biosynthesis protein CobW [Halobacteriales archaeon QH_9_66_26]|nr:MAG: cobalamin biosynthesis protein CobW [Halobacteriales archaeon QH_9_66_26]
MTNGSTGTMPVTVASGPLGAGKTTLLNNVLDDPGGRDVAVIVNDMGEVNVDADLLDRSTGDDEPGIVDLSNGCICCRLQDDLLTEATRLAETRSFDALVIESSGISEPIPVARTFLDGSEDSEIDPTDHYRLDTMVSVIDAYGFWKEFDAGASLPEEAEPDADRPLADVLIEGIEFCDVLLLNKCDLVPDEQLAEIEATIRTLQPRAEIVRTTHSDVDPARVIDTGRFDFAAATRSAGAAEAHGVSSFVYARERAFHPERLDEWLDEWGGTVIRAKGVFRLAGREDVMGLNQAGPSVRAGPIGEWGEEDDRRTRLVFIGTDLDEEAIVTGLDGCLLDDGDADREALVDPFPTA